MLPNSSKCSLVGSPVKWSGTAIPCCAVATAAIPRSGRRAGENKRRRIFPRRKCPPILAATLLACRACTLPRQFASASVPVGDAATRPVNGLFSANAITRLDNPRRSPASAVARHRDSTDRSIDLLAEPSGAQFKRARSIHPVAPSLTVIKRGDWRIVTDLRIYEFTARSPPHPNAPTTVLRIYCYYQC